LPLAIFSRFTRVLGIGCKDLLPNNFHSWAQQTTRWSHCWYGHFFQQRADFLETDRTRGVKCRFISCPFIYTKVLIMVALNAGGLRIDGGYSWVG
jgi:hypothetical protein